MDPAREDVKTAPSSPLKNPTIQRDPAKTATEKEQQAETQRPAEQEGTEVSYIVGQIEGHTACAEAD